MHLNYLAIIVAAVAVFVFAAGYYIVLARQRAQLSPAAAARSRPPAWLMGLELLKSLVVAAVVAGLVALAGIADVGGALKLALALWVAFPLVLLVGSVTQENVPSGSSVRCIQEIGWRSWSSSLSSSPSGTKSSDARNPGFSRRSLVR